MAPEHADVGYPMSWWDPAIRGRIGVGLVLANPAWQGLKVDDPPGWDHTRDELDELLRLQGRVREREMRTAHVAAQRTEIVPPFLNALAHGSPLPDEQQLPRRRPPRTVELCEAMRELGRYVIVHYKARFNRPRPYQLEPRLRPMVADPGHPAYPSGHSLQVHLIAGVLAQVVPAARERLDELAWEIATNREWAGVHYRSDTEAGKRLAKQMMDLVAGPFRDPVAGAREEWSAYAPRGGDGAPQRAAPA